jgi:cytochrome P450
LHHSPAIFGPNHNVFLPSRWDEDAPDSVASKSRLLMHFGLGGRQCIGKTMATTNIYKVVTTLLSKFDFQLADDREREEVERGEWTGKLPPLISVGVSDLDGGLWVRAKERAS